MPDSSTLPFFPNNVGEIFVQVDSTTTPDNVFFFLRSDGNVYRLILKGPYPARVVCRSSGDKTTELQAVFDHTDVNEVVFDNGIVTINGTLNCGNKRITIREGARLEGTGTISGASIDFNWDDDAIASSLTLTGVTHVSGLPMYASDASADNRFQVIYYNSSTGKLRSKIGGTWMTLAGATGVFSIPLDDGGAVLGTGVRLDIMIPFDCVITGWTLLSSVSASIVIDLWVDTYGNYPPTVADTITGGNKPTLSSATKAQNNSISWALTKGTILRLNIDSVTSLVKGSLNLEYRKS